MPTPRRISGEEVARNKKKQQILRQAGYNVKVDGNWGEWQNKKYKEVMAKRTKSNKANVGVLALPAAAALGSTMGSTISAGALGTAAASAAMAAPVALTLLGPALALAERIRGVTHSFPRSNRTGVETVDATRVARPEVITPVRRKVIPISRADASTAVIDSTQVTTRDSVQTQRTDSISPTMGVTGSTAPRNTNAAKDLWNSIKSKLSRGKKTNEQQTQQNKGQQNNQQQTNSGSPKKNRHLLRKTVIGTSIWEGAPALIDIVGNIYASSQEPDTVKHEWVYPVSNYIAQPHDLFSWIGKAFEKGYRTDRQRMPVDSTNTPGTIQDTTRRVNTPVRSSYSDLDSINKYIEILEK